MNLKTLIAALLILTTLSLAALTMAQTGPAAPPETDAMVEASPPAAAAAVPQLRDWLALPTDKLVEIAREQGCQALAELRAGRPLARFETREASLGQFRIDLLGEADAADQQRAELFKRVEDEVEQIRQQFAEDPVECANQISITVQLHRDAILGLKADADGCRQLAAQTDAHLKAIRPRLLALRREYEGIAEGRHVATRTRSTTGTIDRSLIAALGSDLQSLGLQDGLAGDKAAAPIAANGPRVSKPAGTVEQAMAELESLK
jgi:hypothetical protein